MKSLMSVLEATISGAQGSSVLLRNGLVAPSEADVAGRQILDFHAIPGGPAKGHGVLRMTHLRSQGVARETTSPRGVNAKCANSVGLPPPG
jgi:hypothetical protein